MKGGFYVSPEAKLLFVIRIRVINAMHPKTKKILQLLRLRQEEQRQLHTQPWEFMVEPPSTSLRASTATMTLRIWSNLAITSSTAYSGRGCLRHQIFCLNSKRKKMFKEAPIHFCIASFVIIAGLSGHFEL
ncbi:uncharacterized protein [Triticum aestivum]|uniref:uncharacterized protein isoform X1 n=1 Tax=Triticum aestivum TaxID=4565 RepID=UPI001D028750|nr:uncharacterized protein LOC123089762 isoform X1 [Triticum aestivum]